MTYQEYKIEVTNKYGPAEWDYNRQPLNESARLLSDFKIKQARDAKAAIRSLVKEKPDVDLEGQLPESKLLDKDLRGFDAIQKDILRAYFKDRSVKPSVLAQQFNQSYQFVAGFLKSNQVQLLVNKHFTEDLDEYTKLSLLALVKAKDPRATLVAAEYRNILNKQGVEDTEFKAEALDSDDFTKECLTKLADWLLSDTKSSLTFTKP